MYYKYSVSLQGDDYKIMLEATFPEDWFAEGSVMQKGLIDSVQQLESMFALFEHLSQLGFYGPHPMFLKRPLAEIVGEDPSYRTVQVHPN